MKISTASTRFLLLLAATAVLLTAAACSTNQSVGAQVDDKAITTKVKAKLTGDPEVNALNVDVDTIEGVVRLSGTVEKPEAKQEAERIARDTKGVVRVVNDIEIGKRTFGERVEDGVIVTKIKAKLTGDGSVNSLNVDVDSKEGVVTLSGRVETHEAKSEAERIARDTKGVREVHNRLEVIGKGR